MEAPGLPSFTIQANSTFVLSGDTLAIKCLIYNISILTLVNSYSINWFKDDVQITKSFRDVINNAKYRVQLNIAKQEQNVMSELQIKNITIEDEGSFTCELKGGNIIKQRQSIFILIDDSNGTIYVNLTGYDVPNVTNLGISMSQTPFYKTHTKFDADDVTPVEMMETNVTNTTVAMENITDYDITDITDIPSVEMISSSMPEEITNYGQTTIINIKNTTRSGQISTGIIIWICVASAFLLGMTGLVLFIWRRKKKRLNTPGPNYLRPHTSRFQPVSIEMNQPLAVKGRADGYEIVDKSKNKDHLLKKKKKNYEQATDDTFLNEYRTRGNGTSEGYENIGQSKNKDHLMKKKKKNYEQATDDTFLNEYKTRGNVTSEGYKNINTIKNKDNLMKKNNYEQATDDTFLNEYRTVGNENQDRPHVPQNRTADFEEEIETNAIHGPDESTTITFA